MTSCRYQKVIETAVLLIFTAIGNDQPATKPYRNWPYDLMVDKNRSKNKEDKTEQ